jgi:hypothetical protein
MKTPVLLIASHLGFGVLALYLGILYSLHNQAVERTCHSHGVVNNETHTQQQTLWGPGLDHFLVGAARISRASFERVFPMGTNLPNQVILLYQSHDSLPSNYNATSFDLLDHNHALENCKIVKWLSLPNAIRETRNEQTCTALIGSDAEAYHVLKWHRNTETGQLINKGRYEFTQPHDPLLRLVPGNTQVAMRALRTYLQHYKGALARLQPIAAHVAKNDNTIIVMVCNFGHSEFFVNYICAARAHNMDTSKILLFATDPETAEVAAALGVTAFYDATIFASIPRDASPLYGDELYAQVMMSKVYCVHLISQLGYSFLFQDVDIVPYQEKYLEAFVQESKKGDYDLYFQYDFNSLAEYSPWYVLRMCVDCASGANFW